MAIYIRDILENMELAEDFVKGMSYEEFVGDKKKNQRVEPPLNLRSAAKATLKGIRSMAEPVLSAGYGIRMTYGKKLYKAIDNIIM